MDEQKIINNYYRTKTIIIIIVFLAIIFSMITQINATTFGTYKINQDIPIIQLGNNFTFCNITSATYPNGTKFIQDVNMTKRGDEYNYTINSSYVLVSGTYIVRGICGSVVWAGDYEVNPQGITPSDQRTSSITISIYFITY